MTITDRAEAIVLTPTTNHARFSDYGVQSGDGTATISSDEMRTVLTEDLGTFFEAA